MTADRESKGEKIMNKKTKAKHIAMMLCVALLFQVINPVGTDALINDEQVQEQSTEEVQEESGAVENEAATSEESSSLEETKSVEESMATEESSSSEESADSGETVENSSVTEENSSDMEGVTEETSEAIETESETETETEAETKTKTKEKKVLDVGVGEESNIEGFVNAITEGLRNKAEKIENLEQYKISREDGLIIYNQIINENPDLYYVTPRVFLVDGQYVEIITPYYYSDVNDDEKYQKGKRDALSTVTDDMSDVQKMLVLHDWIITHTDYNHDAANNNTLNETHSAYGVLANSSAVCQGMALAYKTLLDELNIENYIVFGKSSGANHVWNTVVIDGNYYHVDITQDNSDSTDSRYPRIGHDAFLVNKNNGLFSFTHTDYYMYKDYSKLDVPTASAKYDDAFWQ